VPPAPPARPGTEVAAATSRLVETLGARWARKTSELVLDLWQRVGDRQTLGFLEIVGQRIDREVRPYERAKAALALLNARLRKVRETSVRRTGGARGGIPSRMGA